MAWSKMVSMELDDEDKVDMSSPISRVTPDWPWGLRISLSEKEIEKLGLDHDVDVGDLVDMRCFGEVTSVSKNQSDGKPCCRVEIQIQRMKIENEDLEDEDD